MSNFTGYSSKATAVRGLTRHLGTAARNNPDMDLASLIEQVDGKWGFYADKADAAVNLDKVSEEDEQLILMCGYATCPHCEIHLSNGLMDFDTMVDRLGGEKAAYAQQKHEWVCMGCNGEWGAEIPAPKGAKAPTRHYENKSTVDGAVKVCHDLFDSMPDARRKDAIQAAVDKGVAFYTARTQYQKWFKAKKST